MKTCLIVGVFLLMIPIASHAGYSTGKITKIYVHHSTAEPAGVIMFAAGVHSEKPSCSTVGDEWAFSLSTDNGKAMYALLLSASAQGLPVSVAGANSCAAWGDREAPLYITVDFR